MEHKFRRVETVVDGSVLIEEVCEHCLETAYRLNQREEKTCRGPKEGYLELSLQTY